MATDTLTRKLTEAHQKEGSRKYLTFNECRGLATEAELAAYEADLKSAKEFIELTKCGPYEKLKRFRIIEDRLINTVTSRLNG